MAKKMKKLRACIILPTYNERKNISLILDKLLVTFKSIKDFDMSILVVDDNSPDKTWEVVEKYAKQHQNIVLLFREKKQGLGAAYIAGMNYAIKKLKADFVFNMDADMSHDPNLIHRMLDLTDKYDLIIGSRYIKGGGFTNWPWHRKIISSGANLLASQILGLRIKDISSGFRCYKKEIFDKVRLNAIRSQGYAFLEELLYFCVKSGAKVKEIPLVFVDRTKGETKLTKEEMMKFGLTIVKLRLKYGKT